MTTKIIIEVRGGTVIGVYSNEIDFDIAVLDWDNYKSTTDSDEKEEIEFIETETKSLSKVW